MQANNLIAPRVIALTGSIGSGKSTVAAIFAECGATIIDADLLAREAVEVGSAELKRIVEYFGKGILQCDGTLNRKALGKEVFMAPEKRKHLESILHPKIAELYKARLHQAGIATPTPKLIVYVVPLFFESNNDYNMIEKVVVVSAPKERCIERIIRRDHISREEAEQRYNAQLPIELKEAKADIIIKNDENEQVLRERSLRAFSALIAR